MHVNIEITWAISGIAQHSRWPVVGNRVSIVVESRGEVVRQAGPRIEDNRCPKTLGQVIKPKQVECLASIVVGATPVAVGVVVVGREGSEGAGAIQCVRQRVLAHDLKLAPLPTIGQGGAVSPGRRGRLVFINDHEVWSRNYGGSGKRSVNVP